MERVEPAQNTIFLQRVQILASEVTAEWRFLCLWTSLSDLLPSAQVSSPGTSSFYVDPRRPGTSHIRLPRGECSSAPAGWIPALPRSSRPTGARCRPRRAALPWPSYRPSPPTRSGWSASTWQEASLQRGLRHAQQKEVCGRMQQGRDLPVVTSRSRVFGQKSALQ